MPRPSFDAQVHLHSSKQPNAKANDWIVKLGLLPVNEGYLSGKPKFEQGSAEYSLYETTQDATNSMADDYSLEYLESSWASSDSFIDGVVKDILDRHQDVWAQPGVRNRREQAVGPSYPQKLDINNKDHRERYAQSPRTDIEVELEANIHQLGLEYICSAGYSTVR
jgi:hypothetical protein